MKVDYQVSPDGKTITLSWAPQPAHVYVYTLDGSEILIDGKRHFTFNSSTASVKMGIPQDGKPHVYGVEVLDIVDSGSVTHPAPPPPPPPPPAAPANTGAPTISGGTNLGDDLAASPGTWSGNPTSYSYAWYRDGQAIANASSSTHTVTTADQGHDLTVGVTATNAGGTSAEADSAATHVPASPPPPPPPSSSKTLWVIGFSTPADLAKWNFQDHKQADGACGDQSYCDIIAVDPSWNMPGKMALQCRVLGTSKRPPGSLNPHGQETVRAQGNLQPANTFLKDGDEIWYRWYTRVPGDPALNTDLAHLNGLVMQFAAGNAVQIAIASGSAVPPSPVPVLQLTTLHYDHSKTPPTLHGDVRSKGVTVVFDKTNMWEVHLIGGKTPTTGLAELHCDGVQVLAPTKCTTVPDYSIGSTATGAQFHLDMYRGANYSQNGGKGYNTTIIHSEVESYTP